MEIFLNVAHFQKLLWFKGSPTGQGTASRPGQAAALSPAEPGTADPHDTRLTRRPVLPQSPFAKCADPSVLFLHLKNSCSSFKTLPGTSIPGHEQYAQPWLPGQQPVSYTARRWVTHLPVSTRLWAAPGESDLLGVEVGVKLGVERASFLASRT